MEIREYKFDDEELILVLRHHFGSETHFREHKKHFSRTSTKRFFVVFIDRELAGYCTLNRSLIGDLTTLLPFRGQGVATRLIEHLQNKQNKLTIGTSNDVLMRIVERLGFDFSHYRGKYKYYKWEGAENDKA